MGLQGLILASWEPRPSVQRASYWVIIVSSLHGTSTVAISKSLLIRVDRMYSSTTRTMHYSVIIRNMETSVLSVPWGFTCCLSVQKAYDEPHLPHGD